MRISDIETIRGDRDAQKPFVAYGADTTYDAPEPYGEEKTVEKQYPLTITHDEREWLFSVLNEKRKVYLHAIRESQKGRKTHAKAIANHTLTVGIIGKLKQNPSI